jgi:hypothetical protein
MPLNDDATLSVGTGRFYLGPVGTDYPADPLAVPNVWTDVGHTALEEFLTFEAEGGEPTVLATLQNKSLRTVYSARQESINLTLHQFDRAALRWFNGANSVDLPNGLIGVPDSPVPTEAAFLAVLVDGLHHFAIWGPKVEVMRVDNPSMGDGETLAGLPIGIKPMRYQENSWTYALTPMGETPVIGAPVTTLPAPVSTDLAIPNETTSSA